MSSRPIDSKFGGSKKPGKSKPPRGKGFKKPVGKKNPRPPSRQSRLSTSSITKFDDPSTSQQGTGENKQSSSSNKKKEDLNYDVEQQFLLRMPPGPAMALRREVEAGSQNLKDKFMVEILQDMRKARIQFGGQIYTAKLVDLPCVMESLKTTDSKLFYKTADISQMLICISDDENSDQEIDAAGKKKDKDKKYHWAHGVTPPMKNVRKRRFRRTLKKRFVDQPDIEKEVKHLLRMDNEAIDVKWEVVVEESETSDGQGQVLVQGESNSKKKITENLQEIEKILGVAEHDIFGEVSSSDEDDEKDVNVLDSGDEEALTPNVSADITQMTDTMSNMSADGDMPELQSKLQDLQLQIGLLKNKRLQLEVHMNMESDLLIKANMKQDLDELVDEQQKKQQEHEILSSMVPEIDVFQVDL